MTTESDGSYINMGMQAGDKAAGDALSALHVAINRAFIEKCSRGYGENFTLLGFVLRVDGEFWHWEKDGCDKLWGRRTGTATVDMYMSKATWQGRSLAQRKAVLANLLREGFVLMVNKLQKLGVEFEVEQLGADFEDAIALFERS